MKTQFLTRKFIFNKIDLVDVNPAMTPDEIMNIYSETYPELINAHVEEVQTNENEIVYEFKTISGTKG